jgi:hypothetical protein
MAVARITVALKEDTGLRTEAFRSSSTGEPLGWLDVGDMEVGFYGSPRALRRLALDAVRAAENAEELGWLPGCEPVEAAA